MRRAAIGCLVGALAAPAQADRSSIHFTANGDVAVTDNVFAVAPGQNPEADVYMQVRPGFLFAYDAPKIIHELSAEVEVLEYVLHSDQPSLTFRGAWQGFFTPGPRTEVILGVDGSTGELNALSARNSPDQTIVTATPAGATSLRQAGANEVTSWQSTEQTRTSQAAFGHWIATDDNLPAPTTTNSFEAGLSVGFDRSFKHDTIGLEVGGSFLRLERITPAAANPGSTLQHQLNPRATAVWRHDFSQKWSGDLDGGIVYVNPLGVDPYNPVGVDTTAAPYPIFGGLLAYTDVWGRASVDVRRAVAPNLFLAQNTLNDSAIVQLALPLPWLDPNPHTISPKLVALASAGVERTQLIDPITAKLQGQFDLARVDVGVEWAARPGQVYGVRYEFVYQHGDAMAALLTPSFHRNTLFFTFAIRIPERIAAQLPRRSQSVRSDRSDVAPIGTEPVVPDTAVEPGTP